jgi:hypothetical protein
VLSECLGASFIRLWVPFIAPRQLGAVGGQLGRPILSSVVWCTGKSGAPPDSYCSCPVLDFFPYGEQPTVGPWDRLAHRTLDRCAGDSWLTGQSGVTPDSPVNYSHVALMLFSRAMSSPQMTHRTVRCTTGQSGDF